MGGQGMGDKDSGAECEHTGLAPQCLVTRELFPDKFLKPANISLLERVDRLDRYLSVMEDKAVLEKPRGNSGRHMVPPTPSALEKRCKPTECVLEEVEEKGTLVERVSELEQRVVKLSTELRDVASQGSAMDASAPHDGALRAPHRSGAHVYDHEEYAQYPQDPIDVEKHEVTTVKNTPLENNKQHNGLMDSENFDKSPRKQESPLHKIDLGHQGTGSSEGMSVEEEEARGHQHQYKTSEKLKRWITKRLHIGSAATRQGDKHTHSMTRCWSSHLTSPRSCWKGETYAPYRRRSLDEDSS